MHATISKNFVLVGNVQTTHVYTESLKNQEVHRSGDMTEGVVDFTPYLTVHPVSVILTGINRVVIMSGGESVVTQHNIVFVVTAQTTSFSSCGKNQEVHLSGDLTGGVVETTPYLTVHLVNVILTGTNRVVVVTGWCGNTANHCYCAVCTDYKWVKSRGTQKWRYDGRCGRQYLLPDGAHGQCDPDGENPCCSRHGWCGDTEKHCSCSYCKDFKFAKWWRESGGTQKWRNDGMCGRGYPLPDGTPGQCDPNRDKPCCSSGRYGECGNTAEHCSCRDCTNYKFAKWWRESGGTQKWRNDGKCGTEYTLPDGTPAQCDPDGDKPCCSSGRYGECGNTAEHCSCWQCTNYKYPKWWSESGGTQRWRYDGRCGSSYPLPDGTPGQCDPDGDKPCCGEHGWCGDTATFCSCSSCTNYRRIYREWEESGGTQRWRYDGRCGSSYPLPDGTPGQCDPDGDKPCCGEHGWCGDTATFCSCSSCTNYRRIYREWEESGGTQKWRYDGRCGSSYPQPDGTPTQCDPDGDKPCCSWYGECGNTAEFCSCGDCTNYARIHREFEESGGTQKWRYDGRCGRDYTLPDGTPAQCDPDGRFPCCDGRQGRCSGTREDCTCHDCIDYIKMRWRNDGRCGSNYLLPDRSPAECNPGGEKPCCSQDGQCSELPANCFCENCTDHRLTISWKDRMCYNPLLNNASYDLDAIFKCNNGRKCVGYKDVCNRKNDCGDMSDEIYCKNHTICKSTLKTDNPKFVSKSATCNGYPNCFDWSDECNDSCGREILGSWALKIACCFMGILAIVFNCVSMVHGVTSTISNCLTEKMMITKVLMSLIGLGDFLIGFYLIVLFIYDSLVYGSSYCENQPERLTGKPCMILGVISTVGSQLSLFSMTTLSCIIMHGVVSKKMSFPSEVTRRSVLKATLLALMLLMVSLVIAVTPLVPTLEDYFIQGIYYQSDNEDLFGFRDKVRHYELLGRYSYHSYDYYDWRWSYIREKMSKKFGDLPSYPVHFYGNDGVCLFKYFVRRDNEYTQENILDKDKTPEGQRYTIYYMGDEIIKTRNVTVWTMLVVNLICFLIITVCYIAITCKTRKSTQESGQHDNPDRLRENKAMQNRIILIIVTDFLCWLPFIMISGRHNLKYIDASTWYTPFAMTVLPINSVINPLLYDKILLAFIL